MGWKCLAACAIALAACQPLYGGAPEKLLSPPKKKRPPEAETAEAPIKYIEDCTVSFQDDPKKYHPNPKRSGELVELGDTAQQLADKAKEPQTKVAGIKDALDKYRQALIQDPYNANATLKLALEYDLLLRKGCALALLKRLAALTNNQKFERSAKQAIQAIVDNEGWFKGYRNDAKKAVGQ